MPQDKTPVYVKDLFEDDFFLKLKNFILNDNFYEFYSDELQKALNIPDTDFISNVFTSYNYDKHSIYTFADVICLFETVPAFQSVFIDHLFKIKYAITKFVEMKNNELFNLQIHYKIIDDFFEEEINQKLSKTQISNLSNTYIAINDFINFNTAISSNKLKIELLFFICDYISTYLELIFIDLNNDIAMLLESYKYESKYKLQVKKSSPVDKMSKELKEQIRKIRGAKYNLESGRIPKNRSKSNNYTNEELLKFIKNYKEELIPHRNTLSKFAQNNDKNGFEEYLKPLMEKGRQDLCNVMTDFYNLKKESPKNATIDEAVHRSMNDMFDLNYFDEEKKSCSNSKIPNCYETMKKDLKRKSEIKTALVNQEENHSIFYDKEYEGMIEFYDLIKSSPSCISRATEHLQNYIEYHNKKVISED